LVKKNIEDVEVGQRTMGRNPLREQVDETIPDVDPETWRKLKLRMTKQTGKFLWIDLLRPLEWVEEVGAERGQTIFLDLAEFGAVGDAEVLELGPCPPIAAGPGNVVTGKFVHEADENSRLLELSFSDGSSFHGVTDNHPVWSEDRNEYLPVGQLTEGERVQPPMAWPQWSPSGRAPSKPANCCTISRFIASTSISLLHQVPQRVAYLSITTALIGLSLRPVATVVRPWPKPGISVSRRE
jgi:hypothetical protein